MRAIKFIAYYRHDSGKFSSLKHHSTNPENVFRWKNEGQPVEICQFTGLHDKNGKEIYEGDIVNLAGGMPGGTNVFTIKYDDMMAVFELRNDDTEHLLGDAASGFNAVSVVGNIHQNPELLNK